MKKVLITGANKSIGFETARQLAQLGYYVYITARDADKGNAAVRQLNAEGLTSIGFIQMDVTNAASVTQAYNTLAAQTNSLDVLINNAGISGGFPQPASSFSAEEVQHVFETNVFGVIRVTQAFLPLLKAAPSPRIVNVSSGIGSLTKQTNPAWEFYHLKGAAYGPSKTALNAYTISLAYELKDLGFKVNAIDPGYTATDFNGHRGYKTVAAGAAPIVQYATIGDDGPTGGYFGEEGEIPW